MASEDVKRLNPHLRFDGGRLVAVAPAQPQRERRAALERVDARPETGRHRVGAGGQPILRVTIVAATRRRVDVTDNFAAGYKGLRDAIARWFGLDDGEETIEWIYERVPVRGCEGTIVMVTLCEQEKQTARTIKSGRRIRVSKPSRP